MIKKIPVIILVAALIGLFMSAFIVDETEQVVVTMFGKVVREPITEPGLYFKVPGVHTANYFPKNLQNWDGEPGQIPTLERTYIHVDTFGRWLISDPLLFFQTMNNVTAALGRLDAVIDAAVRDLITNHPLIETVRLSDRELGIIDVELEGVELLEEFVEEEVPSQIQVGRMEITKGILAQARPRLQEFGIDLVDVKIKRLNYVEDVRRAVYERMIAERRQMAEMFRSEGRGEARRIDGDAEKELRRIQSEAYRTAQEIKGTADAEAAAIYAEAYGRDPEFYSFMRSLEIYREAMDERTTLVLSTDAEFLRYLKEFEAWGPEVEREAASPAAPVPSFMPR